MFSKGVRGAYSESAAEKAYPNCEAVPCEQFDTAFEVSIYCLIWFIRLIRFLEKNFFYTVLCVTFICQIIHYSEIYMCFGRYEYDNGKFVFTFLLNAEIQF